MVTGDPFRTLIDGMLADPGGMFGDLLSDTLRGYMPPENVPLQILGLDALPADRDALKAAFRRRLKETHPDIGMYSAIPGADHAAAQLAVRDDLEVREVLWACQILIPRVPEAPRAPAEREPADLLFEQFQAAREAHDEERWKDYDARKAERDGSAGDPEARSRRARRAVTHGCAYCGSEFAPGEEIWQVRYGWPTTVHRCCEKCGRWRACRQPQWRSQCARCHRPLVYADDSLLRGWCSCAEPHWFTFPAGDKCARCGDWRANLGGWSCSSACTKALYRVRTKETHVDRKCEQCHEIIDASRGDAVYCSNACRQRAYRERRRA
jgi:hypothetical protein